MDKYCRYHLISGFALIGYFCAAENNYGTISLVGPVFVNREVTLKVTPFYPWGCEVEWKYIMEGDTRFQTMNGPNVTRYSENGSFFLKWNALNKYNGSEFYAGCSTNTTIRTRLIQLNMKDIPRQCGAVVLLSPVFRGADVKLGYFPSDAAISPHRRLWKKNIENIQFHNGHHYVEEIVSEYLYILTIFHFNERDEGSYSLECNAVDSTEPVQLYISERPSYPVLGPQYPDFNTTQCIYQYAGSDVYCKTNNGSEPVKVLLILGHDSFVLPESEQNRGLYRINNVHQQIAGLSRRNVTCQVSNAALETPYEVHGILCNVEKGSLPFLTVPAFLHGESSTSICEVRNAIPAPVIEFHIDNVLLADVQQIDLFNISSHTFTSTATIANANKTWNGKQMCCTRKSTYSFGLTDVSVCKNISMKEVTTNPALAVTEQWHSILYAVAGILPALLGTTFTVLLFRRCKHHESETILCRRRTVVREQHLHVHDVVQPNLDTTALHNLGDVSASTIENTHVPSLVDMEETEDRLYENVCHYENVNTLTDHRDKRVG
ncbi:uncharacterized protein LOC128246387 [Mya arenaria]|uniref:uncharacterized protein LOC128246387 n=1 Tax=Mya arenaria TaxID=6604 RepID=UPI0022E1B561|nr:uncharacterized protein LOC128246387 [Mya arenaria]